MRNIIFELCSETIDACIAAREGGAARIELCSALSEGGLTPSHGLIRDAVLLSGLPIHGLVRPRGGDFLYSDAEVAIMREDIVHMKSLGVSGVVLGLLKEDGSVDRERTQELVRLARPLEVTFHRAFDSTPSLEQALEDVIATGCDRLLTSGGQPDVVTGAASLAKLVAQAAGRIEIAIGGGLRLQDAAALARLTGAQHFHGSMRSKHSEPTLYSPSEVASDHASRSKTHYAVAPDAVRTIIERLRNA
ncbi:copper homeostasis protein CutC [Granulicella arctica]|uniref:PF03932 family protein CutC n=1 Tax=Granulicella arctica TaxID=940613 RepID=A0A7Y9TRF7_9BACT|nr:copper homeostasis protein CutC [Granulicella arctica]NYF78163.1 copper homeostasis protein [Granulicella arctica]